MTSGPLPVSPSAPYDLEWDAENRLARVLNRGALVVSYTYDAMSRRISQTTTSPAATTWYVYDGWNVIAEYTGAESPVMSKTYVWGLDLSGTLQGAGGVGGLLAVYSGSNAFYPTWDGNGNVSEYLTPTGTPVAHFEYDPFGNTVVGADSSADFTYRFSTKPLDFSTGLYYYGYRYYDPLTGRWPGRDPIEEDGGENLYVFVANSSCDQIDYLGHTPYYVTKTMDALGWTISSKLMNLWMSKSPNSNPSADSEESIVKMDWIIGFPRGKELYDALYTQGGYKNNSAKSILVKRLKTAGIWNTGGHFGDLSKSTKEVNSTETYVNTRAYTSYDLDDLGGALGRFQMTANVEGKLILDRGMHVFCYEKVGTYVVDSYNFNDSGVFSQFLGSWDFNNNTVSKFSLGKDYTIMTNKTFRDWRDVNNKGGDFMIYSDTKLNTVTDTEILDGIF